MAFLHRSQWLPSRSLSILTRGGAIALLAAAAQPALVSTAKADEPLLPSEPLVLSDTAVDLLDVADAFDRGDPFDLNLRLSFDHEQRSAPIRRESSQASTGGYLADMNVANYQESIQRLIPEINIGILRELALSVRLPVILADNRKLTDRQGSSSQTAPFAGLPGETLFSVPFQAPTRSGIEYLAVGLDLGLMSQFRNPAHPNWVMGLEGRFNVSEPMHACNANPTAPQLECADSRDVNRDGVNDPYSGSEWDSLEGTYEGPTRDDGSPEPFKQKGPGVSRGTHALKGHAYVSRRLKYIEPYTGIEALAEFQIPSSAYGGLTLEGALVNHPPLRGTVIAGMAVIPWEQPEKFSRVSFDFRVTGTYVSEGRDYSELFDALGSSDAASLRHPNFSSYMPNIDPATGQPDAYVPSVVDPTSTRVNFTGLTDVQQHGDYKLRAQFTWQAGRYVKFDMGLSWRIIQSHLITIDQACNPDYVGEVMLSGPCKVATGTSDAGTPIWQSSGLPNPYNRKTINDPGQRYLVGTSNGFKTWIRANVLF